MEPRKSKRNFFYSFWLQKYNTLESVDRISALPDSILSDILSLLSTKNAVATSTLSKRWKFLWRTVRNLDFYRRGSKVKHLEGEDKKFCGFVNNVLLHLDAGVLNKFRLEWRPKFIESHVTSWIKTAISRNVHELSLALADYRYDRFDMPISVFNCDSLRSLELEGWICLSAANVSCLPRLEILHLKGVIIFQSDEALEKIVRGCPVLKLIHIDMKEPDFRFIKSSTTLRRLELKLGFGDYLKLETSSLEHLKLYCYRSVNFVQKNLSSLVEVDFGIYLDY